MNQGPVVQQDPEAAAKAAKVGKIMIGVFAVLTLLFVCGGGVVTGIAASGSERDGVMASKFAVGPAFFALSGLLVSVIAHFAIKENVALKVIIPLVAAFVMGPCSVGCLFFFYKAIWPSL